MPKGRPGRPFAGANFFTRSTVTAWRELAHPSLFVICHRSFVIFHFWPASCIGGDDECQLLVYLGERSKRVSEKMTNDQ